MKKNKFRVVDSEYVEIQNIYDVKPIDGTIIGMATEEEMELATELEYKHHALTRLQEGNFQFTGSYRELLQDLEAFEKEFVIFYRALYKRLSIPWEWTIRIDLANGPIYVINEDMPYYEEYEESDEYDM
ncbi:hypothetical protein [Priestia taiwanensis]|uniref:Uncharacterized protein n=1 Tax=Priestia taiwanensis TaxID=1347902 RepID=A0A917AR44_9BACI|nr:hypothetical protein [Priestia taiwanensis]MBM7363841.1 hypothetical protein [Priestia taiwanensis]GGE69425.1 hypothetical protein GCM10007140_19350 [Priestia taiwanensis]